MDKLIGCYNQVAMIFQESMRGMDIAGRPDAKIQEHISKDGRCLSKEAD
jgi:ABC-type dipeptide/oligopeptide/nickel transport system ATPase component